MLDRQSDFIGKKAHVIGMARSGQSAAEILIWLGARVTMHDQKDRTKLFASPDKPALVGDWAEDVGIQIKCGDEAYDGITEADFVVTSPGVPETCIGIEKARTAGIPTLPEIELAYRVALCPILAITGTNGKTTTTALVGGMLRCDGMNVFIAGNIVAGDIRLPLTAAAFKAKPTDVIVAEISSFQLEMISSFKPKIAALLNISGDHMDRYTGIESYAQAKSRIFEYQDETDFAVLNALDPAVMRLASGIRSNVWQFSSGSEVREGTYARGSEVWQKTSMGDELVCDTAGMKLRGKHNLENVLAASAMALAFGASKECVAKTLETFSPPEHRLEPVAEIKGVEFLNNSMCTNVDAAVRSLEAIGRPAVVIAGGKDKGSEYGPLGESFKVYAKHVVLIGKDASLIEAAARLAGFESITHANSMKNAVEAAWQHASFGDTVILSPGCASFDMFKDFEDRGEQFKVAVMALKAQEES
jgi:UDP-N-acetylmuramoylalanine--D-glutamate ligase